MKYFFILILFGCSSVKTINLKDHSFNVSPKNIIWFQIAGLSPEHLALIRFDKSNLSQELENFTCLGNMWAYNSYKLRPTPNESFLTQVTGKTNIKGICADYSQKPIWYYLKDRGFETAILEVGISPNDGLDQAFACSEENEFKNITYFFMGQGLKGNYKKLDLLDMKPFKTGRYQISCEFCEQNLFPTFTSIMDRSFENKKYKLFILRDFSFLKYLKTGDFNSAKYFLKELAKTYKNLREKRDTLILISSSGMAKLDLPSAGAQWMEFEKKGKNAPYKNDSLLSFVLAQGPSSEKFCGIYSESDLMERILMDPRKNFKKFLFW
ncbi:MAG: hypothetical protein ACHQYQ_01230 [Bacteriovoracales bacterium]